MEAPGIEMDEMLEIDINLATSRSRARPQLGARAAMNTIHIVRPYTNTMIMPLLSIPTIAQRRRAIFGAIAARDEERARAAFDVHVAHLEEVRQRALADRRAEEVPVSELARGAPGRRAHPGPHPRAPTPSLEEPT